MTEISGNPNVQRSDSVAASYLKTQDYILNPISGAGISITVNAKDSTPTSGTVLAGMGSLNIQQAFTTSGRTITAAGSGIFAPLGYFAVQVSGNTVVVPYFAI
jgi:hypothetical protein